MAPVKAKPKLSGNPLTRKVGPLPLWAWALVVVGSYLAYAHFSGTSSASAAVPTTSPVPFADSGAVDTSGGGGGSGIPQLPIPTSTTQLDPSGGSVPAEPGGDVSTAVATTPPGAAAPVDAGAPPDATVQPPPSVPAWMDPGATSGAIVGGVAVNPYTIQQAFGGGPTLPPDSISTPLQTSPLAGFGGQLTGVQIGGQTATIPELIPGYAAGAGHAYAS